MLSSLAVMLYVVPLHFVLLLCFNIVLLQQPFCFCEFFDNLVGYFHI